MPFKLYVESRLKQETGGNSSDGEFSIELPHAIRVKDNPFFDTFLVPNTVWTIRVNENNRFHVRKSASTCRVCTIVEGQYNGHTLKNVLSVVLNTRRSRPGCILWPTMSPRIN